MKGLISLIRRLNESSWKKLHDGINRKESLYDYLRSEGLEASPLIRSFVGVTSDTNPSCTVNNSTGKWKDFSTGYGGGYYEMVYYRRKLYHKQPIQYKTFLEQLLLENPDWVRKYGISSIYDTAEFTLDSISYLFKSGSSKTKLKSDLYKYQRELLDKNGADFYISNDANKLVIWKTLRHLNSEDEIVDFLAELQHTEMAQFN